MTKLKTLIVAFSVMMSGLFANVQTSNAYAVCLAPNPLCVVVGIGLLAGVLKGLDESDAKDLQVTSDLESLKALNLKLEQAEFGNYIIRISDYYENGSSGLKEVVRRYKDGDISGNLSLESLYKHRPKMFKDLDKLDIMMRAQFGDERVDEVYGSSEKVKGYIDWKRYAALASDAILLYENSFAL